MVNDSKYRSRTFENKVIAFSISYERESLLARGMGLDHLQELCIRLARPIVRQSASLAYGGNWVETEENFTYKLLQLISAEQEDNSHQKRQGPDTTIGRLYNHSCWPHYLRVTPRIEAQWINSCRVIRFTQQEAGFAANQIVRDDETDSRIKAGDARATFNAAATLSAMRRQMMDGSTIPIPDSADERIPRVDARILIGGGIDRYTGFLPGIFEEALVTFEKERPIYLLGGFGGAASILADAILEPGSHRPSQLTIDWHMKYNTRLPDLLKSSQKFDKAKKFRSTAPALDALFKFVKAARKNPSATLRTGLSDSETRELLKTQDIATADRLVRQGVTEKLRLDLLPA